MIKRKKKVCKGCGEEKYLFGKGLCTECYRKTLPGIKKMSDKHRDNLKEMAKTWSEDKLLYNSIWKYKPHVCESCGRNLGAEPRTFNFHHILPKRNYPQYRHSEWNIMLLCLDCHSKAEVMIEHVPKVKERTEELKRTIEQRAQDEDSAGSS